MNMTSSQLKEKNNLDFTPRPYQIELLEKAIDKDIIIYLKTGSGKTFIAVMLIKNFSEEIEDEFSKGGKRTIFLCNNVPLVIQQAEYLRHHTNLNVGEYYGDKLIDGKKLDLWSKEIWDKELEKNQILVMSAQVLVELTHYSFLNVDRINLIIFDECHHATGNHPYSQIMYRINRDSCSKPRIVGLTASIVNKKCDLKTFFNNMKKLEDKFDCKIETASLIYDDDQQTKTIMEKPKIIIVQYQSSLEKNKSIREVFKSIREDCSDYEKEYTDMLKSKKELLFQDQDLVFSTSVDTQNPFKIIKKELSDLENLYEELGTWSLTQAYKKSIEIIQKAIENVSERIGDDLIKSFLKTLEDLFESSIRSLISKIDEEDAKKVLRNSSQKLNCLINLLQHNYFKAQKFHSIVFVERRSTAFYLSKLLEKINELDEWKFIKADYLFGQSSCEFPMEQKKVVDKFRKNEINTLIATNIVEEGIDIPACNLVIRFSKINNFGSFIQSKGRARSSKSFFYIMQDEKNSDEYNQEIENFILIEENMENQLAKKFNEDCLDYNGVDEIESLNGKIKPYHKGSAKITCHTAISLINRYCSSMEQTVCGVLYPFYDVSQIHPEISQFQCSLRLPPNSVLNKTTTSEIFTRKKWAKMHAALLMCIELDKVGELADNLTILSKEEWLTKHYDEKEEKEISLNKKQGSSKNKREYSKTIADEFFDSFPKINQDLYLYHIDLREESLEDREFSQNFTIGFLSSKLIEKIPEFKLYPTKKEINVNIRQVRNGIRLNENQLNLLKDFHVSVMKDILLFKTELTAINGVITLFLKKSSNKNYHIDWDYMNNLEKRKLDLNFYLKEKNNSNLLNKIEKSLFKLKMNENRFYKSVQLPVSGLTPLSQFDPTKPCFKEYFKQKYDIDTSDVEQPMIELSPILNCDKDYVSMVKKNKKTNTQMNKFKEIYICEHVILLPFEIEHLMIFRMLPSIFYRANCLLKANKLKNLIDHQISKELQISIKNENEASWNESLKFNRNLIHKFSRDDSSIDPNNNEPKKVLSNLNQNESDSDDDDESDSNQDKLNKPICLIRESPKIDCATESDNQMTPPKLMTLRENKILKFPNTYQILQCLTLKSSNDDFDLERYEILGDCFLKLTTVLEIYQLFTKTDEGKMAHLKSNIVSNKNLFKLSLTKNLNEFIISECFNPVLSDEIFGLKPHSETISLSDKSFADSIEALIGVYLINLGPDGAKAFLNSINLSISKEFGNHNFLERKKLPNPLFSNVDDTFLQKKQNLYKPFQEKLGYKFKNIIYLYQAFTHQSDYKNKYTSSFQKLEFLGDSVLDLLITFYIFADEKEHSPGELTNLRKAFVCNRFFGHLAVKHNFHKYLSYESPELFKILNEYLDLHGKYSPDIAYLGLETNDNYEKSVDLVDLEPPKFLADIFESVAGAIYLDSNCNLNAVWNAYYKFFHPYLERFKECTPQSPITALASLKPNLKIKTEFSKNEETDEIEAKLTVDKDEFIGKGKTNRHAKLVAYKLAVRKYDIDKKIVFF